MLKRRKEKVALVGRLLFQGFLIVLQEHVLTPKPLKNPQIQFIPTFPNPSNHSSQKILRSNIKRVEL
jgi:hypothetical protein